MCAEGQGVPSRHCQVARTGVVIAMNAMIIIQRSPLRILRARILAMTSNLTVKSTLIVP